MKPLAPIVDRMRELAREELPSPRTCKVRLWDDGTVDVVISHKVGTGERQAIRYERSTGEIIWEHVRGARWEGYEFADGETLYESIHDETVARVLEQVEPPYGDVE